MFIKSEYASVEEALGHYEAAIAWEKFNIALGPEFTRSLYGLVRNLSKLDRYAEAENYLTRPNRSDPTWAGAARLTLLVHRGDLPPGSPELRKVLADPRMSNASRGIVCFTLGDVAGGVRYWRQIEPGFLQIQWQFISSEEHYFAKGVVADRRYQALLDELGIGRKWRAHMRTSMQQLTPVTGIRLTSPVAAEDVGV